MCDRPITLARLLQYCEMFVSICSDIVIWL
jgi:hypothetical protein